MTKLQKRQKGLEQRPICSQGIKKSVGSVEKCPMHPRTTSDTDLALEEFSWRCFCSFWGRNCPRFSFDILNAFKDSLNIPEIKSHYDELSAWETVCSITVCSIFKPGSGCWCHEHEKLHFFPEKFCDGYISRCACLG